jgi:mycothiol synthase
MSNLLAVQAATTPMMMSSQPDTLPITHHPMRGDADFWQVHDLLVESYRATPLGFNWDIRRWEGKRFYSAETQWDPRWAERCHLWEAEDGLVVAAAHPDGEGEACLQVRPGYRHLEEEMLAWAEAQLAAPSGDGRRLSTFVWKYDQQRQRLLEERHYEKSPYGGVTRRLFLGDRVVSEPRLAEGYYLRVTQPQEIEDCQRIADLLNAAFNRDFHTAAEYQNFARHAPSFRQELDLVAVAPDGSFAAYVGIPYDERNRRGIFEPVCTHPNHRRKGLAQALMIEGLRRLATTGATEVTVETGDMVPANLLYESMGFTEKQVGYTWQKMLR